MLNLDPNTTFAILVVLALAIIVPVAMLFLSAVIGPRKHDEVKLSTYESGIVKTVGSARERFSIKFYLIAILFIIFDVEAVFMYPWAVNFRELGLFGFVEMLIFLGVLFAGFIYILKRGALKWE